MSWGAYRPCTVEDQKKFFAIPGMVDYVTLGLRFSEKVQLLAEAVRSETANPQHLQILWMGGKDIEADEDNREGYGFVNNGAIAEPFQPIILPVLE